MIVSNSSDKLFKLEMKRAHSRRSARRVSLTSNSSLMEIPQRSHVQHDYIDHLHDPLEPTSHLVTKGKKKVVVTKDSSLAFPERLHRMLDQVAEEDEDHIVSWQPHGRCFVIHKRDEFVNNIMPRYFQQSKLTSFQRQLNLYGFIRLTVGKDRGGYYHPHFLRGRVDLTHKITRTRIKGNGIKAASSPETEPDFYQMEFAGADTAIPAEPPIVSQPVDAIPVSIVPLKHDDDGKFSYNTPFSLSALLKKGSKLVSPPESPMSKAPAQHDIFSLGPPPMMELDDTVLFPPHTGDLMEFEGQTFRYLEHDDMLDFLDEMYYENEAGINIEGV